MDEPPSTYSKGCLRFSSRRSASHWAKLPGSAEPRLLATLLFDDWAQSLPEPTALLSVVGGGKASDLTAMPEHAQAEVSRGLARVRAASVSVLAVRKERVPSADQRAEVGGSRVEGGILLRGGLVVHS